MTIIDQKVLDELSSEARSSARLRKNRNLHLADDAPCHRLLNAIEPGSYIMPHRHRSPDKDESLVVVRGTLGAVSFDDTGTVTGVVRLKACGDAVAIDIPHGTFHTVISLESGTVFFESKGGPYRPLETSEKAPWAPEEGATGVAAYYESVLRLF